MRFERLRTWTALWQRRSRTDQHQYALIADDIIDPRAIAEADISEVNDSEECACICGKRLTPLRMIYHNYNSIFIIVCTAISVFLLAFSSLIVLRSIHPHSSQSICVQPRIRREWRSLTTNEKHDFIQAVLCLAEKPSKWGPNGTMYDDFALLHGEIGSWSHQSVSFLPWHRYTLHLWEASLRDHCGYQGSVPYWDWSLDWMDLHRSSIWDNKTGFGGDGDPTSPLTVGGGRCVTDGPFSSLRPIKYNHTYIQHCLSRGFRSDPGLEELHNHVVGGELPGEVYRPEIIGQILRIQTYQEFVKALERKLHGPVHLAVRGDLFAMTGANDPIFFLHHAQLDRLWWRWQQEDLPARLWDYSGKHMYNSTGKASLSDHLMFAGFTPDIATREVMDTQGGLLCYRY